MLAADYLDLLARYYDAGAATRAVGSGRISAPQPIEIVLDPAVHLRHLRRAQRTRRAAAFAARRR